MKPKMSNRKARERIEQLTVPDMQELREIRVALGLTGRKVSNELGYSTDIVCKWENGHTNPNLPKVRRLLGYYRKVAREGTT